MRRISHNVYSTIFGVAYLGLMTNLMLLIGCLPVVVLLITTDPSLSWPLIAILLPVCAPAVCGAFTAFHAYGRGETRLVRAFWAGWRATWRKAAAVLALGSAVLCVVAVDVRFFSAAASAVLVVPLLGVLALLVAGAAPVALVALAEAPGTRLRDLLRAGIALAVRRWYLSLVSLAVLVAQFLLFSSSPAFAIGLTAAPALYLVWANARFTLRPLLPAEPATAA